MKKYSIFVQANSIKITRTFFKLLLLSIISDDETRTRSFPRVQLRIP